MLTAHLWSLTGAAGAGAAAQLTRRRIARGRWALSPPPPPPLAVAGADAHSAELWWAHRGALRAFDLSLISPRELPRSDASAHAAAQRDVTAVAADRATGAVWTGHADGALALWGASSGRCRGARCAVLPAGSGAVVAIAVVARGVAWAAAAKGGALRAVEAPAAPPSATEQRSADDGGATAEPPRSLAPLPLAPLWVDAGIEAAAPGGAVVGLVSAGGFVWGARAGAAFIAAWDAPSGRLAARWACMLLGPPAALAAMPLRPTAAPEAAAVLSCHARGGLQVWSALGAPLRAFAGPFAPAAVGVAICAGLACVAHADGILRLWPLAGPAPSRPAGELRVHRSGLRAVCAADAGGGAGGVITAGRFGSIALWPAQEIVAAASEPAAAEAVASWRAEQPRLSRPAWAGPPAGGAPAGGAAPLATQGSLPKVPPTPRYSGPASTPPPPPSSRLGARVIPFSEVTLKGAVGEGSYGTVYQGTWLSTEVAVKIWRGYVPPPAGAAAQEEDDGVGPDDSALVADLVAEVALMQELRHPNIVMLLGVTLRPPSIVQEYCGRGSLYGVLRRHGAAGAPPLAWRVRLHMALGAATGMCYLHGCRPAVLHRDLKSPNLLVDRHWRVKVGDFGLSRVTLSSVAIASVAGVHSPRWMAPEVLVDGAHSKASDVFSFAVVLWELATLAVPWESANQWQVMHAVADEKARCPLPTAVTPPFPMLAGYLDLMGSAWAHEPRERPTFGALVTELQRLLDALVAAERPPAERSVRGGAEAPKAVAETPAPPAPTPAPVPVPEPPAAEPEPAQPPPAEPLPSAPEATAPERAPTPPPEAPSQAEAPAAEESSASVAPSLAPEASEGGTLLSPAAPAPPTGAAAKAIAARKAAKARKAAAGAAS